MSGAVVNAKKVEDSNQKRLESMREKLDEFKKQKSMVRASLNDLESKAKKIVFESDSDDDFSNIKKADAKKTKLDFSSSKSVSKAKASSTKKKLLSSDSDTSGSEDERAIKSKNKSAKANKDEEETIQMFESKINLDERKANKVIFIFIIIV
jgi:hypothetical protein